MMTSPWWDLLQEGHRAQVRHTWALLAPTAEHGRFPEERRAAMQAMARVFLGGMPRQQRPAPELIESQLAEAFGREDDLVPTSDAWTFLALSRYTEWRVRPSGWHYYCRSSEVLARCFEVWVQARLVQTGVLPGTHVLVDGRLAVPRHAFMPRGDAAPVMVERMDRLLAALHGTLTHRQASRRAWACLEAVGFNRGAAVRPVDAERNSSSDYPSTDN